MMIMCTGSTHESDDSYNYSSIAIHRLSQKPLCYSLSYPNVSDQWPPPAVDKIFRLTMIASKQETREKQPMLTEVNFDHTAAAKVSVELRDILSQPLVRGKRRIVLIEIFYYALKIFSYAHNILYIG